MFNFFKKKEPEHKERKTPVIRLGAPPKNNKYVRGNTRNFTAGENNRLVSDWTTYPATINYWLAQKLYPMIARSREQCQNNPFGKRFISLVRSNIVGPNGVNIQAQSKRIVGGKQQLDRVANEAIEESLSEWGEDYSDYDGALSFLEIQALIATTWAMDGECIIRERKDRGTAHNPYGYSLEMLDPAQLDVTRNQREKNGNITRLGIEFLKDSYKPVRYWFRGIDDTGSYDSILRPIPASEIIHIFRRDFVKQVRGIPWMYAAMFKMKMLDGYDDAAITAARVGASQMGFFTSEDGDGFTGDDIEQDEAGNQTTKIMEAEAGVFQELDKGVDFKKFDPNYPHEQYPHFVKSNQRTLASALDISYHSLSNDLESVNYSSIRAGILEDRELHKQHQNIFVNALIKRIYRSFIATAILNNAIKINGTTTLKRPVTEYFPAKYMPRRWASADPLKDAKEREINIKLKLKSRSSYMREDGDDPETVWQEIEKENEILKNLINIDEASSNEQTEDEATGDENTKQGNEGEEQPND